MHSDAPRHRGSVARLADLLAEAAGGSRPTSIELAELLWLARQMGGDAPTPQEAPAVVPPTPAAPPPVNPTPPRRKEPAEPAPDPTPPDDRVPLRLPSPAGGDDASATPGAPGSPPSTPDAPAAAGHTPVRVPVPPMVTHPLTLQRALRALKRRVPSPVGHVIDEEATAHRIARLGGHPRGWLPVLRPAEERWLRLCLIHDAGPTMPIWRPLVHELHTALVQSGIFRTVELHRAEPDGTVPPQAAHAPATGRTVTLVISDCMGPQWRDGAAGTRWYRTLRRWAAQQPVAVIQPLPERLWRTTALPTTPGTLSSPHPAAPSGALTFTPYAADVPPPSGAVPVPVLEPAGTWLSHWAALVAGAGGAQLPGAVGWLDRGPPSPAPGADASDITDLTPEGLVLRFRSTASPEAFRLAGHLAVGEPQLPLMRLVQAAVEERPRPQHLAEVILSGMLSSGGAAGSYEFREGVRELLLRTLPRTARVRTRELLARVGGLIDERAGTAPGELRAVASSGGGAGPQTAAGEPFATVTPESVRQLGGRGRLVSGRYRLVRQLAQRSSFWLAQDTQRDNHAVLVQHYPRLPQGLRLSFTDRARALSQFRHPNVAAVRDFGVEDNVPYLVSDFIDGRSLRNLLKRSPHGLPPHQLVALIPSLADAVSALHAAGLTHGALTTSYVIVTPHGPMLSGLDVAPFGRPSPSADLRDLGQLIHETYAGPGHRMAQQPPLPIEGLDLSEQLREELRRALIDLDSGEPVRQRLGVDRLINLAPHSGRVDRDYSLLGPLRITQTGRPLATGSPQEQAMLCMLLLRRGRGVTHDELIEGLWDAGAAPRSAQRLLGTYASRLRDALGPDSVVTANDTYSLALPTGPDVVDLFHSQRLHDDARDARFAGDFPRAHELVRSALDLWRGTPLNGIPGPAARAARADIDRLRQSLLQTQLELNRELGATEQEQRELDELLQEFPHTEDEVLAPHEELPSAQLDDLGVSRELPDDQPTPPGTTLTFEYLTRPPGPQAETLHRLGREISHLLITGGIGPDHFELQPRAGGWDVTVAPEVHVLHALTATLDQLPAVLAELRNAGLGVTVTHEPDPTVSALTFPAELQYLFNSPGSRATVIVSNDLHDRLSRSGRMGNARFGPVPQSDDWYCEVTAPTDATATASTSTSTSTSTLSMLLASRSSVILGFEGPIVLLHSAGRARADTLSLLGAITEARDVEDALAGRPPLAGKLDGYEGGVHPLDLLRAHQDHTSAGELRARLSHIEQQNLSIARPTPHLRRLLDTLAAQGLAVAVAGDCDPAVMAELFSRHDLASKVTGGVHGRDESSPLLPDPDCLRRALLALGSDSAHCVMVGSSPAELLAARQIGLPFIGYRRDETSYRRLRADGCELTLDSLAELIDALRDA